MCKRTKISVCITTFQHEHFISETIESVISQIVDADIEVLVGVQPFDNRDKTVDLAFRAAAKYPNVVKVILLPADTEHIYMNGKKTGRANFLNTFSYADGDYVCHLDGDDAYARPDKLQKQLDIFKENENVIVVTHATINEMISSDKAAYWKLHLSQFSLQNVSKGLYFHLSSCMYKNIFKGNLPFDFTIEGTGDLYLLMQYLRFGDGVYLPILASRYRVHDGGIYSSVGSGVKQKRMVRNLRTYANSGYFDKHAQTMLLRADKIEIIRKYTALRKRGNYFPITVFFFKNISFFTHKILSRLRRNLKKAF